MRRLLFALLLLGPFGIAQSIPSVPHLIKFSGALKTPSGSPLTGVHGLTIAIYKDQQNGSPVWMESQNVELDEQGRYTVLLGSTKSQGVPLDLFTGSEPRWLEVQVQLPGYQEEPRVQLVSVPYALRAADAATLGGLPVTPFVLTPEAAQNLAGNGATEAAQGAVWPSDQAALWALEGHGPRANTHAYYERTTQWIEFAADPGVTWRCGSSRPYYP